MVFALLCFIVFECLSLWVVHCIEKVMCSGLFAMVGCSRLVQCFDHMC